MGLNNLPSIIKESGAVEHREEIGQGGSYATGRATARALKGRGVNYVLVDGGGQVGGDFFQQKKEKFLFRNPYFRSTTYPEAVGRPVAHHLVQYLRGLHDFAEPCSDSRSKPKIVVAVDSGKRGLAKVGEVTRRVESEIESGLGRWDTAVGKVRRHGAQNSKRLAPAKTDLLFHTGDGSQEMKELPAFIALELSAPLLEDLERFWTVEERAFIDANVIIFEAPHEADPSLAALQSAAFSSDAYPAGQPLDVPAGVCTFRQVEQYLASSNMVEAEVAQVGVDSDNVVNALQFPDTTRLLICTHDGSVQRINARVILKFLGLDGEPEVAQRLLVAAGHDYTSPSGVLKGVGPATLAQQVPELMEWARVDWVAEHGKDPAQAQVLWSSLAAKAKAVPSKRIELTGTPGDFALAMVTFCGGKLSAEELVSKKRIANETRVCKLASRSWLSISAPRGQEASANQTPADRVSNKSAPLVSRGLALQLGAARPPRTTPKLLPTPPLPRPGPIPRASPFPGTFPRDPNTPPDRAHRYRSRRHRSTAAGAPRHPENVSTSRLPSDSLHAFDTFLATVPDEQYQVAPRTAGRSKRSSPKKEAKPATKKARSAQTKAAKVTSTPARAQPQARGLETALRERTRRLPLQASVDSRVLPLFGILRAITVYNSPPYLLSLTLITQSTLRAIHPFHPLLVAAPNEMLRRVFGAVEGRTGGHPNQSSVGDVLMQELGPYPSAEEMEQFSLQIEGDLQGNSNVLQDWGKMGRTVPPRLVLHLRKLLEQPAYTPTHLLLYGKLNFREHLEPHLKQIATNLDKQRSLVTVRVLQRLVDLLLDFPDCLDQPLADALCPLFAHLNLQGPARKGLPPPSLSPGSINTLSSLAERLSKPAMKTLRGTLVSLLLSIPLNSHSLPKPVSSLAERCEPLQLAPADVVALDEGTQLLAHFLAQVVVGAVEQQAVYDYDSRTSPRKGAAAFSDARHETFRPLLGELGQEEDVKWDEKEDVEPWSTGGRHEAVRTGVASLLRTHKVVGREVVYSLVDANKAVAGCPLRAIFLYLSFERVEISLAASKEEEEDLVVQLEQEDKVSRWCRMSAPFTQSIHFEPTHDQCHPDDVFLLHRVAHQAGQAELVVKAAAALVDQLARVDRLGHAGPADGQDDDLIIPDSTDFLIPLTCAHLPDTLRHPAANDRYSFLRPGATSAQQLRSGVKDFVDSLTSALQKPSGTSADALRDAARASRSVLGATLLPVAAQEYLLGGASTFDEEMVHVQVLDVRCPPQWYIEKVIPQGIPSPCSVADFLQLVPKKEFHGISGKDNAAPPPRIAHLPVYPAVPSAGNAILPDAALLENPAAIALCRKLTGLDHDTGDGTFAAGTSIITLDPGNRRELTAGLIPLSGGDHIKVGYIKCTTMDERGRRRKERDARGIKDVNEDTIWIPEENGKFDRETKRRHESLIDSAAAELLNRLLPPTSNPDKYQNLILVCGDGSGSRGRGYSPSKGQTLVAALIKTAGARKDIKQVVTVIADEFRTSSTCPACLTRRDIQQEMLASVYIGKQEMHRVKACSTCGEWFDRDAVAVVNLALVFIAILRLGAGFHPMREKFAAEYQIHYPSPTDKQSKPTSPFS
ncbi:hypothetical protein JCM10213_002354 [Rhodosporidiobolus nylandii]